jgi:hypothetical protein
MRKIEELLEIMLENKSEFSYGLCGWVGELRCLKIISHEEEDFLKHYIQNNNALIEYNVVDNDTWDCFYKKILEKEKIDNIIEYVNNISLKYNMDKKNIIKNFINYIIRNRTDVVNPTFLNFVENLMHSQDTNNETFINYSLSRFSSFF